MIWGNRPSYEWCADPERTEYQGGRTIRGEQWPVDSRMTTSLAMLVDGGKVVDYTAEPGYYIGILFPAVHAKR